MTRAGLYTALIDKLKDEFESFKTELLAMDTEAVFASAHKIHSMECIIDSIASNTDCLESIPTSTLAEASQMTGLLEWLYSYWLKVDDSFSEELIENIVNTLMCRSIPVSHSKYFNE